MFVITLTFTHISALRCSRVCLFELVEGLKWWRGLADAHLASALGVKGANSQVQLKQETSAGQEGGGGEVYR